MMAQPNSCVHLPLHSVRRHSQTFSLLCMPHPPLVWVVYQAQHLHAASINLNLSMCPMCAGQAAKRQRSVGAQSRQFTGACLLELCLHASSAAWTTFPPWAMPQCPISRLSILSTRIWSTDAYHTQKLTDSPMFRAATDAAERVAQRSQRS